MDVGKARRRLRETWQMFHQAAMRGASELRESAYTLAATDSDDETAAAEIRREVDRQPERAVKYCLDMLSAARETRQGDRAFRLLQAAVTGKPVRGVESARAELFGRLDEMETMPIVDAYSRLVRLVPQLGSVAEAVEPFPADELEGHRWRHRQGKLLDRWVGVSARHPDPLIGAARMHRLALDYLRVVAGDATLGPSKASHREVRQRDLEKLEEKGWSVEELSGGRRRVSTGGSVRRGC
jgi:hypothetical protein